MRHVKKTHAMCPYDVVKTNCIILLKIILLRFKILK